MLGTRVSVATIRDVAHHAGVSVTTVSHVVNNTRPVEPETQARVRVAIEELGYRPNLLARGLRRRKTNTIGLLVPDNSNPFFAEVARAIEDTGFEQGYSVILCNSDMNEAKQDAYLSVLLAKQVDGLLLISSGDSPDPVRRIMQAGVPVVVVDRELGDLPVDQVLVDNEQGGYLAGCHLVALGHTRIGYIAGPSDIRPSRGRVEGLQRALREAGLELDPEAIARGDGRYAGGERAMRELLARGGNLTAVFAYNDLMAIGAVAALRRAGLRVPEDISVIGFDDIPQAATTVPAITTVAQPTADLGRVSARLLLDRLTADSEWEPSRVLLQTSLVERESCRKLGGAHADAPGVSNMGRAGGPGAAERSHDELGARRGVVSER
jgi:LacI family transcriptional regulator